MKDREEKRYSEREKEKRMKQRHIIRKNEIEKKKK